MADQFTLDNSPSEIFNLVIANTDNVQGYIRFDLFGLPETTDVVIGANIGFLNALVLLANKSFLSLLAFITASYLTITDWIILGYLEYQTSIRIRGYILCFNMIYFLNDGFIGKFYLVILTSIIGFYALRFLPAHMTLRGIISPDMKP